MVGARLESALAGEGADRFNRITVETLAKRSANRCSNPDCTAITSGPADDETKAITVGEAAHIFGAMPGSARYDANMLPAERGAITNGIWLCRNCHKIVDADPAKYPAPLLFEWRQHHEHRISSQLGKTGDQLRLKVAEQEAEEFREETYLARRIIIDRPYAWEYKLLAELLRSKLEPLTERWRQLEGGLYMKPIRRVAAADALDWLQDRLSEMSLLAPAIAKVVNEEIARACGPPGAPGCPKAILQTTNLLAEAGRQLLNWEENVRFTRLPSGFGELSEILSGVGGRSLSQLVVLPRRLIEIFADERPTGAYDVQVVIDLPPGWSERCQEALDRISKLMLTGKLPVN